MKVFKKQKNYKGFSIMESIIGIAIVSGVFVTFLALLPKAIKTESHAQRVVIATNLAQEGIEMVRNLRDNNLKIGCKAFDDSSESNDDGEVCLFPSYWQFCLEVDFSESEFDFNPTAIDDGNFERSVLACGISGENYVDIISTVKYDGNDMAIITTKLYSWGSAN